jgi:protoporphyrinogen/coproporphyrinogen III oxidase
VLADAMVTGIFAGDPALLSMPACFPRLVALEQEHGSVLKGMARTARQRRQEAKARGEEYQRPGKLWSFREGLGLLIDTLSSRLKQPPELDFPVKSVRHQAGENKRPAWAVIAEDRRTRQADAVILACPAYQQASIVAELDRELAETMGAIPYNRVAVVALGYWGGDIRTTVNGFGFIAPQKTRRDLLGVQWCSSIYPNRAPRDQVLLRAICGGWHRPDVAAWDDQRLLAAVREELRLTMKITDPPVFSHIVRWDRAIPQYHLGHLDRVAAIEQRLAQHPGLFVGGNAYHGVALNDCTEQGLVLAGKVQKYLEQVAAT